MKERNEKKKKKLFLFKKIIYNSLKHVKKSMRKWNERLLHYLFIQIDYHKTFCKPL